MRSIGLLLIGICLAGTMVSATLRYDRSGPATQFACTRSYLGAREGPAGGRADRYGAFIGLCPRDARVPIACNAIFDLAGSGRARERIRLYRLFIRVCARDVDKVRRARRQITRLQGDPPPPKPEQLPQPVETASQVPTPIRGPEPAPPVSELPAGVILDSGGGVGSYRTLAAALPMVREGGTIWVASGDYRANEPITKRVTLARLVRASDPRPIFHGLIIDAAGTVRLEGVRIESGGAVAALQVRAGTVELVDSEVLNPEAGRRGREMTSALFISGGDIRIEGGTIGPGGDAAIIVRGYAHVSVRGRASIMGGEGYGLFATDRADLNLVGSRFFGGSAVFIDGQAQAQLSGNQLVGRPDQFVVSVAREACADIHSNYFYVSRGGGLRDATPENWLQAAPGSVRASGNRAGRRTKLRWSRGSPGQCD